MNYRDELIKAMNMLGEQPNTIFIGQSVAFPGHIMTTTLEGVPKEKLLELPVAEDMQLGIATGLALMGYFPICIYPRMDFLILACNQLVNHLDKLESMSQGDFKPKVIIRTMVGSIHPLHSGPQHCQDHTEALAKMLTNIDIYRLEKANEIVPAYQAALASERSTILIEAPPRREGYEE